MIPTPGASRGVEGAFALVYSGMTGTLGPTVIAVFVWRFATYCLLPFDGLINALLGRKANGGPRGLGQKDIQGQAAPSRTRSAAGFQNQ
jgi:hypothetical protein